MVYCPSQPYILPCATGAREGAFTVAWHRPCAFRKVLSLIVRYASIGYKPAR